MRNFLRFLVVHKTLKVEHVSLEFIFLVLLVFQHFHKVFVFLRFLFVNVASIIATSRIAVHLPLSETQPAEIVAAVSASHMVAPLVLLNKRLALRTRLRVGLYPRNVIS